MSKKPQPPGDLWAQLDAAIAALPKFERPEGSFTAAEFGVQRGGLSQNAAYRLLSKLVKAGVVEAHKHGAATWYSLKEK